MAQHPQTNCPVGRGLRGRDRGSPRDQGTKTIDKVSKKLDRLCQCPPGVPPQCQGSPEALPEAIILQHLTQPPTTGLHIGAMVPSMIPPWARPPLGPKVDWLRPTRYPTGEGTLFKPQSAVLTSLPHLPTTGLGPGSPIWAGEVPTTWANLIAVMAPLPSNSPLPKDWLLALDWAVGGRLPGLVENGLWVPAGPVVTLRHQLPWLLFHISGSTIPSGLWLVLFWTIVTIWTKMVPMDEDLRCLFGEKAVFSRQNMKPRFNVKGFVNLAKGSSYNRNCCDTNEKDEVKFFPTFHNILRGWLQKELCEEPRQKWYTPIDCALDVG